MPRVRVAGPDPRQRERAATNNREQHQPPPSAGATTASHAENTNEVESTSGSTNATGALTGGFTLAGTVSPIGAANNSPNAPTSRPSHVGNFTFTSPEDHSSLLISQRMIASVTHHISTATALPSDQPRPRSVEQQPVAINATTSATSPVDKGIAFPLTSSEDPSSLRISRRMIPVTHRISTATACPCPRLVVQLPVAINATTSTRPVDKGIAVPHPHDVLCGRGNRSNVHPGNVCFRRVVEDNEELYAALPKFMKQLLSRDIVRAVASQQPPGRFLIRDAAANSWREMPEEKAIEKTSQAFRDACKRDNVSLQEPLYTYIEEAADTNHRDLEPTSFKTYVPPKQDYDEIMGTETSLKDSVEDNRKRLHRDRFIRQQLQLQVDGQSMPQKQLQLPSTTDDLRLTDAESQESVGPSRMEPRENQMVTQHESEAELATSGNQALDMDRVLSMASFVFVYNASTGASEVVLQAPIPRDELPLTMHEHEATEEDKTLPKRRKRKQSHING